MNIRPAEKKDAKTIFGFIQELEEAAFDYLLFQQYYAMNLANENYIYLVAEVGDEVVGYISCHGQILLHHVDKVFEIHELFVKENYRKVNIGKRLVESLEAWLRRKSYRLLEVTPNIKRVHAHRFYVNNGFEQTHLKFTKILD